MKAKEFLKKEARKRSFNCKEKRYNTTMRLTKKSVDIISKYLLKHNILYRSNAIDEIFGKFDELYDWESKDV